MMKMMRKIVVSAVLLLLMFSVSAVAQVGAGIDMGVGARALSFAGNHTAVANDLSAAYWNPAALAFMPVREFQLSFDAMRTFGTCDVTGARIGALPGAKNDDYRDRIRFAGAGAMTAIPTVQGGLSIAAVYEAPLTFDDFSVYGYRFTDTDTTISENAFKYGDLNRISVAFGIQVAPQVSAGLAVSVLTGGATTDYDQKRNGRPYNDVEIDHSYLGYSLTFGAFYLPADYLKLGMRFNTVVSLGFKEEWALRYAEGEPLFTGLNRPERLGPFEGKAYIAPKGAIGAGLTLPWLTTALDLRFTLPYTFAMPGENIPDDVQARYFKMGAGLGLEAPIPTTPVVLRAGYSLDECDLYQIVHRLGDDDSGWDPIDWDEGRDFDIIRNKHTLSFGAGLFTSGFGLELSYAWQTWGMAHDNGERRLEQIYSNHRLMAALIFRY
ncbi:MAG: hypothetical protein FWC23_04180 [Chitinispirillia bacterium]|nr:hypothetical protein [Chitinispirillia bacterium]MCL2268366.1 hypothetical protein [Chitinispirillia bacterium]